MLTVRNSLKKVTVVSKFDKKVRLSLVIHILGLVVRLKRVDVDALCDSKQKINQTPADMTRA